jgi:hypothetical protein
MKNEEKESLKINTEAVEGQPQLNGDFLQYKKELIYRKNQSKQIYERYIKKINNLLLIDEKKITFISLEESDSIRMKEISNNYFFVRHDISTHGIYSEIIQDLKNKAGSYYVFIDHDWEYCGCFQMNSLGFLKDKFRFGNLITDDIVFIESSFISKISIDYYEMNNKFYIDIAFYNNAIEPILIGK